LGTSVQNAGAAPDENCGGTQVENTGAAPEEKLGGTQVKKNRCRS